MSQKCSEIPRAHSLVNVWEFGSCCVCLSLSPWYLREGGTLLPVSLVGATKMLLMDFILPKAKEPPSVTLFPAECLYFLLTCLKIIL